MKKAISALLVVIMILPIIICLAPTISADSLYKHKIVSVVYDNSGSMEANNKCLYASYAMQAFCGMLNSDDQLYITYMNNPYVSQRIDLSPGGIQASVDSIRGQSYNGGTPYEAVQTAYSTLMNVKDENPNTQYWLVVITDGAFSAAYPPDHKEHPGQWVPTENLEEFLDESFTNYASQVMPNGTHPQITFMGIGNSIMAPTDAPENGIHVYKAANETKIMDTMSKIADKISGRTRLQNISDDDDYITVNGNKVQVSSKIPLLNIAVFNQKSDAVVTGMEIDGKTITPSRSASLSSNVSLGLTGGAFLLGDSQTIMKKGTYTITFDKEVKEENIIVLFEPALEARVSVMINGSEVTDFKDLDSIMATDKISVSYKIYEMGTNNEVPSKDLPEDTEYEIVVYENNTEVKSITGEGQALTDYEVKETKTKIIAGIKFEGFNPIEFALEFTPTKYVPRTNYTVTAALGSTESCIQKDSASENESVCVCFTVLADGVPVTDVERVKSLNPVIKTSILGNDGDITYTSDGKIVFTPKSASSRPGKDAVFDVSVTCTIKNGASASEKYQVDSSIYEVVFVANDKTIKKTELFNNKVSASFYVTKEGVRLSKSEVGENFKVILNKSREDLEHNVNISDDGIITITPYSKEKHEKGFFLTYWMRYFSLDSSDITITIDHARGTAAGTLDVVGAGGKYVFLNVVLWLLIELLIIIAIIAYIIRYMSKARFSQDAVLYVGNITRNPNGTHELVMKGATRLNKYNRFINLWNPFKKDLSVSIKGVSFSAARGNRIICNQSQRFADSITPKDKAMVIDHPKDIIAYCRNNSELVIHEIKTDTVLAENNRTITCSDSVYYFTRAKLEAVKVGANEVEVIESAVAFCYTIDKK